MAITKVTTGVIDMSGNAGGLTWVKGTTSEQPSGVIGEIREDTDTKRALVYTDETGTSEWRNLKEASVSQTFTADYLIVAGGGGGGYDAGGGGGAGGYLTSLSGANVPSGGSVRVKLVVGSICCIFACVPTTGCGVAGNGVALGPSEIKSFKSRSNVSSKVKNLICALMALSIGAATVKALNDPKSLAISLNLSCISFDGKYGSYLPLRKLL